MASVKSQAEIRPDDVCSVCGETVRPLRDEGAPDEPEATGVGWTCACPRIEGPQVPVD